MKPISDSHFLISECLLEEGKLYRGNEVLFEGGERREFQYLEDCRSACKDISAPYFSYNINSWLCLCKSARSPDAIENDRTHWSGGTSCDISQTNCTTCNIQCTTEDTLLAGLSVLPTGANFTDADPEPKDRRGHSCCKGGVGGKPPYTDVPRECK